MILRNPPCSLSTCPLALTFSLSQVSLSAGLSKLRSLSTRLGLEPARQTTTVDSTRLKTRRRIRIWIRLTP